jgi:hypothetical protein
MEMAELAFPALANFGAQRFWFFLLHVPIGTSAKLLMVAGGQRY